MATALRNKRTSWKMRLEGAEDSTMDSDTLDFLGSLGTQVEPRPKTDVFLRQRAFAAALNKQRDGGFQQRQAQRKGNIEPYAALRIKFSD